MQEINQASIKEKIWHSMRADLISYAPDLAGSDLAMCCACGRLLPFKDFSLEHLIPRQALKKDPLEIRLRPDATTNIRAGNILLCQKPLKLKSKRMYENGCNSWKGKYYDGHLNRLFTEEKWPPRNGDERIIISALCLGYFALFSKYGYRATLIQSGLLMRRQFFTPSRFLPDLPVMSQILLGNSPTVLVPEGPYWTRPFAFSAEDHWCLVISRNFTVPVPTSENLDGIQPKHLKIVPQKYALRPDFTALFE